MASVDPGASSAIWRSVADVGLLGEVQGDAGRDDDGRPSGSKSAATSCVPPRSAPLEVDRHQAQPLRHTEAELDETPTLPGLRARLVDLEDPETRRQLGPPLGEGVETGAKNDVLRHAVLGLLGDQVLDEAGAGDDAGAEPPGAVRIHVRSLAPAVVGRGQPKADLVFEDVWRRIDLDVHGPPEGDAHRRSLRRLCVGRVRVLRQPRAPAAPQRRQ